MLRRLRKHLSFANVASATALFVAISTGGAYATHLVVNGSDVQDGSLTGADVRDESLTYSDVAQNTLGSLRISDNTLQGVDIKNDSLTGDDIDESKLGQVPNAAKLGGRSPTFFLGIDRLKAEAPTDQGQLLGDGTRRKSATCPSGYVLLSGGPASVNSTSTVLDSFWDAATNSWGVRINDNGTTDTWTVVVLCAIRWQ